MSDRPSRLLLACACIVLHAFTACTGRDAPETAERAVSPLVGEWIEIHPRREARLSLVLNADSSASGTFTEPDALPGEPFGPVAGWRLGTTGAPGSLCIHYGPVSTCQGYSIQADTLFLANGSRTVLVRSSVVDDALEYVPVRQITVPAPGDSGYRQF